MFSVNNFSQAVENNNLNVLFTLMLMTSSLLNEIFLFQTLIIGHFSKDFFQEMAMTV